VTQSGPPGFVYKVDRLTRSLADFAKIVEILDAKGASFVSVTQQFNTTTSMGRLTLNVLLSFAQFEREVTGERIRDKIAASKKKGMWMGGVPPLGYQAQDRRLLVVDSEAEIVRYIFRRYAELGSIRLLKEELEALGHRSKSWTSQSGRLWGGKPFARGALALMLQNRITEARSFTRNSPIPANTRRSSIRSYGMRFGRGLPATAPSAIGLIFGDQPAGDVIAIAGALLGSAGLRIPAGELEQLVASRVRQWLLDPSIYKTNSARLVEPSSQQRLLAQAAEIGRGWSELPAARRRAVLTALIDRVDVRVDQVDIHLRPMGLARSSMSLSHPRSAH
jgi:site-specific DNA recombinase